MTRRHRCRLIGELLTVAIIASACGGERAAPTADSHGDPDVIVLSESARQNAGLTIATARVVERADATDAPGRLSVDESRTARIGSLVEGIVLEDFAQIGDRVSAGQVLATMHSPIVHEAWAQYRKAVADRRRLEKELEYAVQAHERAARLYANQALSLQEVQRAATTRAATEETLDMARTEVRRAEEALEHYGITNKEDPTGETGEQIPVRTPLRGVVLERFVTPGTTVTPGAPLFVVSDLSALWAIVEVDESLLSHVQAGRGIDLQVAAYPAERFPGRVLFVGDVVNPKTRRVTIRCAVPNADGRLKPEMFATVRIEEGSVRQLLAIPVDAVQTIDGQPVVFTVETDGRFRAHRVTTGADADGLIEIRSGLTPEAQVVERGAFVLKSELLRGRTGG